MFENCIYSGVFIECHTNWFHVHIYVMKNDPIFNLFSSGKSVLREIFIPNWKSSFIQLSKSSFSTIARNTRLLTRTRFICEFFEWLYFRAVCMPSKNRKKKNSRFRSCFVIPSIHLFKFIAFRLYHYCSLYYLVQLVQREWLPTVHPSLCIFLYLSQHISPYQCNDKRTPIQNEKRFSDIQSKLSN